MIQVEHLAKSFGSVQAVRDVSFSVAPGEIVGLLGPNGAGKTTTMRILSGLVKKTSGSAKLDGIEVESDPQAVQARLGVLPDGGGLYNRLSARENIMYFGRMQGMARDQLEQRVNELRRELHMQDIIERRVEGFSHGERTKVALARAVIHNPDYILLDEPTNGLDVLTTRAVRQLLLRLKQQNKAIIFSSHLMHEVSFVCDRAIIVAGGRVVAAGTLDELNQQTGSERFEDSFVKLAYPNQTEGALQNA